jgi:hypothetical protein
VPRQSRTSPFTADVGIACTGNSYVFLIHIPFVTSNAYRGSRRGVAQSRSMACITTGRRGCVGCRRWQPILLGSPCAARAAAAAERVPSSVPGSAAQRRCAGGYCGCARAARLAHVTAHRFSAAGRGRLVVQLQFLFELHSSNAIQLPLALKGMASACMAIFCCTPSPARRACCCAVGMLPFKRRKQRDLLDALTAPPQPSSRLATQSSDMFDSSGSGEAPGLQFRHASAGNQTAISSLVPHEVLFTTSCTVVFAML